MCIIVCKVVRKGRSSKGTLEKSLDILRKNISGRENSKSK